MKRKWMQSLTAFLAGALVGAAAIFFWTEFHKASPKEVHEGLFEFTNPLLECEDGGVLADRELASFKDVIARVVETKKKSERAASIAVYFRDLNNGPWFGIDEREQFIPGSLMKVAVMMAYLKHAEDDPTLVKKRITADDGDDNKNKQIKARTALQRGRVYTVEELLYMMIVFSDNQAARLLVETDGWNYYKKIYTDLGLPLPDPMREEYPISVKQYASFFRILFNASYLDKKMSNAALDLLAQSDFHGGIRAGVPKDIKVARKFGERKVVGEEQFHDCGIVYYPRSPYLLCVMSRGRDLADLVADVQDVSSAVFREVDRQMKEQHH